MVTFQDTLHRAIWTAAEVFLGLVSVDAVLAFEVGTMHAAVVSAAAAGLTVLKQGALAFFASQDA